MNDEAREQAFVSAVVTEHFASQAARSAIVGEMTGRAMLYMGAVSSALITFGFVSQTNDLTPFVAGVLPAVVVLGEFTFAAMLRNTLENVVLLRHIQRIRDYYRELVPEGSVLFGPVGADEPFSAAMATIGLRKAPVQMLFTGASTVAAVNSMLAGVGVALLAARLGIAVGAGVAIGVLVAVVLFGGHVLYEQHVVARLDATALPRN
jgi:hypothetical protein